MSSIEQSVRPEKRLVRSSFDKAAESYDAVAVLQREVAERMIERLDLVRLAPKRVLDIGAGTGVAAGQLVRRYPEARVILLDLAPAMVRLSRQRFSFWTRWRRRVGFVCGDAESLPVADASCDLLFSNLTIQWCGDLERTFMEFRRVLRPGGLLMFTTLGPDTLKELRAAWTEADVGVHVNEFVDMHDVGDAMVRAGLADPVLDMEMITMTYPDVASLMRDLKGIGAHNVNPGRERGLTGKVRLRRMTEAYERFRREGRLPATHEVVYGHAWAPEPGSMAAQQGEPGVQTVGLDALRAGLRGRP